MSNEVLYGVVERQARVYSELIDRVIELANSAGHKEFAELVVALRKTYGLDDFEKKASTITDGRFRIRPRIYEEDIEREVIAFLHKNRGQKFQTKDILLNLPGRVTEHSWYKVRKKLLEEKQIKHSGLLYWID